MDNPRAPLAPGLRKAYATAGKATITILNPATGGRFTYKIVRAEEHYTPPGSRPSPVWFVKLLTGPDNENSFQYIGLLNSKTLVHTRKSFCGFSAPGFQAFRWLSEHWEDPRIEVWHEGSCGRCGRKLTVPESIASGLGPVCEGL